MTDSATPAQVAEIRRRALVRRDYVRWLAQALQKRADSPGWDSYDADLDREAAAELLKLIGDEE